MSDNVDRLKQLLFDSEAETLAELSEALKALGDSQTRSRAEIVARIDEIAARVGNDARLEASVAAIIDGALRRAEEEKHALVSEAVAPFVVNTVRTEIRNSKDELVEALYPVTGRIVKAYVASAMKDLADQINRRLETNPVMLRLRSLATGRSVAELAIADAQRLHVEELYLIRRGTGELVEHWPESSHGSNRDQVMSGVLAAINEFATEAFSDEGTTLRHIDLGADRVYLRESPAYLLAAKCSGSAPVAVETVVDEAFLSAIERVGQGGAGAPTPRILPELSQGLEKRIGETQAEISGKRLGASPLTLLAWIIGVPLATFIAWSVYADYRTSSVRHTANEVLAASQEIKGYPTRISVGWQGRTLTVSGLVPTMDAKARVLKRLSDALPEVALTDEVAVVPNALADVEPQLEQLRGKTAKLEPRIGELEPRIDAARQEIGEVRQAIGELEARRAREAESREIERASRLLSRAKASLAPLVSGLEADQGARAKQIVAGLDLSLADLAAAAREVAESNPAGVPEATTEALRSAAERTRSASRDLSGLVAALPAPVSGAGPSTAATPAAQMVAEAEQIDMITVALAQVVALKQSLPPPIQLPQPTAREKLETWARGNAIFFGADAEYRDPALAGRQIKELAALMKAGDSLVRVVGYTDELGGADRNSPLSQMRAAKVAAALRAEGVPAQRIVTLGRAYSTDISTDTGAGSPNRRVEFETGFVGESAR